MPRTRTLLDGTWQFWKDSHNAYSHTDLPPEAARPITVPGPWQAQFEDLRNDFGTGWYRRTLDAAPEHFRPDERLFIHFGAVDYRAEVWLNDIRLGDHAGGYLPFELDATDAVVSGPNSLTVRVVDDLGEFGEVPHGKQSWYGPISGLWQSVWMETRPAAHIRSMKITPSGQQVRVEVQLSQDLAAGDRLDFKVTCPSGACAAGTSSGPEFMFLISDPAAWEPENPFLYTLGVALIRSGQEAASDEVSENFGFRTIEARGGQLWLNGRPLMLRAALDQDYYPELIYTPPSMEFLEDQLRKAKEMGLNCMRVHIKVPDPRYYEAADRLGLLIWTELPNWWNLTEAAKENARQTLDGILERDWNHPSIIIWTIINENWGTNLAHDASHRLWLRDTYEALKAKDPLRLVTDNSACYGNFHVASDLEDIHNYYAMPDHYEHWRDWTAALAGRPTWTFCPQFKDEADWQSYAERPWQDQPRPYADEVRRKGDEPIILSEFGNWGLPDVARLLACTNHREPWWFETGLEWGDGVVYPHNIEQRFHDFGLDQVFPDLSALSQASQRLEFQALKYEIEQIRKHDAISGYVITEFTDVHWECNGLLDMCRNPKIFHDDMAHINADDMIIPEWSRMTYWPGETIEMDVLVSHFSRLDLSGCTLKYNLTGYPKLEGQMGGLNFPVGKTTSAGRVRLKSPGVQQPLQAALVFELFDTNGERAAFTTLDLTFLPRMQPSDLLRPIYSPDMGVRLSTDGYPVTRDLEEAGALVTRTLTDTVYRYAQAGGRVLWLADGEKPGQSFIPYRIRSRAGTPLQGDWASSFSWIRSGPVFKNIPAGGSVDFAFADLTPEQFIDGIPTLLFHRNVHAGIFAGWIQKNAALVAELPVGKGRILVNTFRLSEHIFTHPIAAAMLQDMLNYLVE